MRERVRRLGYAKRTETSYVHWIKRHIIHHGKRRPEEMGKRAVEAFLTHLATARDVAPTTQNLALSAIAFLCREVLSAPLPWLDEVVRAKKPARLPTVLTRAEVGTILSGTEGVVGLALRLLYGTGMRLMECARLRVKDVELARREIVVREKKGGMPPALLPGAHQQASSDVLQKLRWLGHGAWRGSGESQLPPQPPA